MTLFDMTRRMLLAASAATTEVRGSERVERLGEVRIPPISTTRPMPP